jgi:hypothetical protein
LAGEILPSVVTVLVGGQDENTLYGTGFVAFTRGNVALIFTRFFNAKEHPAQEESIHIQFDEDSEVKAYELGHDRRFMMLGINLSTYARKENVKAVHFAKVPPTFGQCCTVGTLSGTKLHADLNHPDKQFAGRLGAYFGEITTTDCSGSFVNSREMVGGRGSFILSCQHQDQMVTLDNIDDLPQTRQSTHIVGAPIFSANSECETYGSLIGVIISKTKSFDVKYGLHQSEMGSLLKKMFSKIDSQGKNLEVCPCKYIKFTL